MVQVGLVMMPLDELLRRRVLDHVYFLDYWFYQIKALNEQNKTHNSEGLLVNGTEEITEA
jgi:hypothetical protein